MNYYIGIDGGGTKTDCILVDDNFNILCSIKGGPLNILSQRISESSKTILQLISSCISNQNINLSLIKCIGIGAAGAGRIEDASKLEIKLKELLPIPMYTKVFSDAEAALEGAFNGKPGCILISGTGSIIWGKDSNGEFHRSGGFGKILGDEGSGFMLGKKALIAALKEFDCRGEKSLITSLLKEKYQIESAQDIINQVYKKNMDVSALAPLVLASAGNNDPVALKIIDEESNELLDLILSMMKKLKNENIEICFTGKLISTVNIFSIMLRKKISVFNKQIIIKEPEFPPAMGSVFLAKKKMVDEL
jgi:N-acetylglucosamine kinase-like BadF-type ATPase